MTKHNQAYLYAVTAVLLWSTVASSFKVSLRYLDFLLLLFYSSFVSLLTLFLLLLFQKKLYLLLTYSRKDYLHSAFLGLINPFLYYIVLFKAYSLLPAQVAQPLNYTWPIMIVLLSIPLLNQKIRSKGILAIFISFSGAFLISTEGNLSQFQATNPSGILLALGSSVLWALFWIYNIKDERDVIAKLFLNFLFGFIFILIFNLIFIDFEKPPLPGLLGAIYVGLFEMGITFVIWSKALKLSRTTAQVSNLIYITPFLSLFFIHLIVGEKIFLSTYLGLIFIFGGILIQQYGEIIKKKPKERIVPSGGL